MILIGDSHRYPRRLGYAARACEYGSLAAARVPGITPSQIPTLIAWYRADQGITLGTVLLAAGTAPPAVTIAGTLAQTLGLYIQIDTAGVGGAGATFKWSVNNGSAFVATLVAANGAVVLGTTGITATFPASAYLTDNIYQATAATWGDLAPAPHNLTNVIAAQQPIIVANAVNARPGLRHNGSSLATVSAVFPTAVNTLFIPFKMISLAAGSFLICDGGGTMFGIDRSTPTTSFTSNGGANSVTVASAVANGAYAYMTVRLNGASSDIRVAGAQVATGNVGGTIPNAGLTLGALVGGGSPSNVEWPEFIAYGRALTDTECQTVEAYLKTRYAL